MVGSRTPSAPQCIDYQEYKSLLSKYEHLLKAHRGSFDTKKTSDLVAQSMAPTIETAKVMSDKARGGVPQLLPSPDKRTVRSEIQYIKKAKALMKQKRYGQSMRMLQELESSRKRPILVRSKSEMAGLLYKQEEYELALQIYEEIFMRHADSSLSVQSLDRALDCAKKLSLSDKIEQYSNFKKEMRKI